MKRLLFILASFLLVPVNLAFATSTLNKNIRIFEDTIWLGTYALMIVCGVLMMRMSAKMTRNGFIAMVVTGCLGMTWKILNTLKGVMLQSQPEWLFTVVRESVESLAAIMIGVTFILLAYSFIRLFNKTKQSASSRVAQPQQQPQQRQVA